jgi:hypothetical protein
MPSPREPSNIALVRAEARASQRIPHPCRILGQQEGVIANSVPKLEGASASVPEPLTHGQRACQLAETPLLPSTCLYALSRRANPCSGV